MSHTYQEQQRTNRRLHLLALIDRELERATAKFDSFNSPHEGWAVIREEMDELWDHVRADTGRDREAMVECIQIATMALRYIYDLGEAPLPEDEDGLRDYLDRFSRLYRHQGGDPE
jgi:hypothetical protein